MHPLRKEILSLSRNEKVSRVENPPKLLRIPKYNKFPTWSTEQTQLASVQEAICFTRSPTQREFSSRFQNNFCWFRQRAFRACVCLYLVPPNNRSAEIALNKLLWPASRVQATTQSQTKDLSPKTVPLSSHCVASNQKNVEKRFQQWKYFEYTSQICWESFLLQRLFVVSLKFYINFLSSIMGINYYLPLSDS